MKFNFTLVAAIAALSLLNSCSKDENPPAEEKGNVTMKFENYAGSEPLVLKNNSVVTYTNANGDQFNVSLYKYYVSNIKLIKSDGTTFAEPESYHLMNAADPASLSFSMANIPAGTYTGVKVLLGVDSLRNVSGAQTGALDPIHGMFWTWASGYIMAKVEGTSPQSTAANGSLSFHLGGFAGPFSVVNEVTLTFPQNLVVASGTNSTVTFKSDVLKWFEAPNLIKFAELSQVGSTSFDARRLAQNYQHSLSVTSVQN